VTRLRVAQVVCTDSFAGVERYVTSLARGLAGRDCDVVVLGGDPDRMPRELGSGPTWHPARTVPAALARLVRQRGVDLVHAHMTAAELTAVLAWPAVRAPIVCTRHFAQQRGSSRLARLTGPALTRAMAAQLTISDYVARTTEGSSIVVRPGVAIAQTKTGNERERIVLVAQRLEPEKRTGLALEAWARSGLGPAGWRLQVAGDGAERAKLERQARQLGIRETADFLGARHDVPELLSRAGIFLATRPDEPFGLSVVEAMASGLPVVAAAGGGHDETVGLAEGAALFPPDEPGVAGRLLAELAADPVGRQSYGARLQVIQRREFTVDRQVEQTLAAYRAVLG
jgi:glycosyltransferase involved in cell wall biosynthesis